MLIFFLFPAQGRKVLRPGALPKRNLPVKSHRSKEFAARRHFDIVQERITEDPQCVYKDFASFQNALQRTKLEGWTVTHGESLIHLNFYDKINALPKYSLVIENNLRFTIAVFNWKLPEDSYTYKYVQRSLKFIKLSKLLSKKADGAICTGLTNVDAKASSCLHVVPSTLDKTNDVPFQYTQHHRSTYLPCYPPRRHQ